MQTDAVISKPSILVIGGTGMLRLVIHELLERQHLVLAIARRPERAAPAHDAHDRYIPLTGDWRQPETFAQQARAALEHRGATTGQLQGAIVWVHSPYRQAALDQVEQLLEPTAQVLQLWGSATQHPADVMRGEEKSERPWVSKHLLLGYEHSGGASRWLTNDEIAHATLRAWDAVPGDGYFTAGQTEPWGQRP